MLSTSLNSLNENQFSYVLGVPGIPIPPPSQPPIVGSPNPPAPSTPESNNQARLNLIGLNQLRNDERFREIDGSGLTVVVIDTGIDATHPELRDNFLAFADFRRSANPPIINNPRNTIDTDPTGHGTHVSGILASTNAAIGVAPGVQIISLRVFDSRDVSSGEENLEDALNWVLRNRDVYNITAVNLSLRFGTEDFTSPREAQFSDLRDEIEALENIGVSLIAAAGNDYEITQRENLALPAIFSTLAVGAVDNQDRLAPFSQRLEQSNMIFAPGVSITSTVPNQGLAEFDGTSQATPHVTGAVALLQEASLRFRGELYTPAQVANVLLGTADTIFDGDDEDRSVRATNKDYQRLNIYKAVQEVEAQGIVIMAQYGASYEDLILNIGDNPVDLAAHYLNTGKTEGRSLDLFNELRYLASNPDLIQPIGQDPTALARHYIRFGFSEGRSRDSFDPLAYLASNPFLIPTFRTDLEGATLHYINTGFAAGLPTNSFPSDQYLASQRDLIPILRYDLEAARFHYVNAGYFEGRVIDSFNEISYLASNPDLSLAFGENPTQATRHYIESGFFENRSLTGFDPWQYIASYPDLIAAFGNNTEAATRHYINFGVREGRIADRFDELRYLASNPDLALAYGKDGRSGTSHYINFGFREGRSLDRFDPLIYSASHDDLARVFGINQEAALFHYLEFGAKERRNPNLFAPDIYIASYPDLVRGLGYNLAAGLDHFLRFGIWEGRTRAIFDPVAYLERYDDLQQAYGNDLVGATRHYIEHGLREGRFI
jgi:hypothetical protein